MNNPVRKPAVFNLDDARLVIASPEEEPLPERAAESDPSLPALAATAKQARPAVRWGAIFSSSLSGLLLLALGLAVANIVQDLFVRSPWLGAVGFALALLAGVALCAMILREVIGFMRLRKVEALRRRAEAIVESDDREQGRALIADLLSLTCHIPQLARARARLDSHRGDIIDGRDLVRLAERELIAPLDAEARRLVAAAGKRVSVVTAVSPRALVDVVFVLLNALSLIRRLAVLYGGRPGPLGVLKLFRRVVSHLAVTGGVAVTDSVLQQVIGHGLAARLSARLGEGMVNGLLTARLGLLAMEVTRPMPFYSLPRPALNDLAGSLLRSVEDRNAEAMPDRPRD
jgi:putative membrane protein